MWNCGARQHHRTQVPTVVSCESPSRLESVPQPQAAIVIIAITANFSDRAMFALGSDASVRDHSFLIPEAALAACLYTHYPNRSSVLSHQDLHRGIRLATRTQ